MATETSGFYTTPYEDKLLAQLINPANFGKTVAEICRIAEVSRDVYYDMRKKDGFWDFYIKLKMDMIKDKVGDLIDATFKYATGNSKCHADRKMLLEMLKLYKEEQNINIKKDELEELAEDEIEKQLAELKE